MTSDWTEAQMVKRFLCILINMIDSILGNAMLRFYASNPYVAGFLT